MRRVLTAGLVVAVLLGAVTLGVRRYLNSSHARNQVANHLGQLLGLPVEIGQADIGFTGQSEFRQVRLFQESPEEADPWIAIDHLETSFSAWDRARGTPGPEEITLSGVTIRLRFDARNRLLTRIPRSPKGGPPLPRIQIRDGTIRIDQEGRVPFVVQGLTAEITQVDGQLFLSGQAEDNLWGSWVVSGEGNPETEELTATLKSSRCQVSQENLDRLPFVPARVWKEIRIPRGISPVTFTFTHRPGPQRDDYRLLLEPEETQVEIRAIDIRAENVRGRVEIENDVVRLQNVHSQVADGDITLDGSLDFRDPVERFSLTVKAEGLVLKELPASWDIPESLRNLGGRLTGQARLLIAVDGQTRTEGEGTGVITGVRIAGKEADIRLTLHPSPKGFRLLPAPMGSPMGALTPGLSLALLAVVTAPPQEPRPLKLGLLERLRGLGEGLLSLAEVVRRLPRVLHLLPQPPEPAALEVRIGLEDVDLQQLAEGLAIKLPIPVKGRVTFQVLASLPVDSPRDLRAYRLRGKATFSRLEIAGVAAEKVSVRVDYADGELRLSDIRGHLVAGADGPQGMVAGNARLGVIPLGAFTGRFTLERVPLAPILGHLLHGMPQPTGSVSGHLEVHVPSGKISDLSTWRSSGSLMSEEIQLLGIPLTESSLTYSLDQGTATFSEVRARLVEGRITGSGEVPLDPKAKGRVTLSFQGVALGKLLKSMPGIALEMEGQAGGTVVGNLVPGLTRRELQAKIELNAPRIRIRNVVTEKLSGTISYGSTGGTYRLKGQLFGGTLTVEGALPPLGPRETTTPGPPRPGVEPGEVGIQLEGAQLESMGPFLDLTGPLSRFRGTVEGRWKLTLPTSTQPLTGAGRVTLSHLRWATADWPGNLRVDLRISGNEIRLSEVSGILAEGRVRGQGVWNLRDAERGWFEVALQGGELQRLLALWPETTGLGEGIFDARLRGTLGREWRGGGDLVLVRGRVLGVEVSEWRVPVSFAYAPRQQRVQIDVQETSATLARGRLTGRGSLGLGPGTRLEGQVRFYGVDLRTLLRQGLDLNQAPTGTLSGRIDVSGHDVRSLDDVTATLDASFQQTQALQLPILSNVVPYLAPGQQNAIFEKGEIQVRYSGSVGRIRRMTLSGGVVNLHGEGTISREGRLNLDVVATTGRVGVSPGIIRLFGLRLPPIGPVPLALIIQVTDYFSNRTVHLHITGSTRAPTVRVEPLSLLTQEAVRYFVNRYSVPIP